MATWLCRSTLEPKAFLRQRLESRICIYRCIPRKIYIWSFIQSSCQWMMWSLLNNISAHGIRLPFRSQQEIYRICFLWLLGVNRFLPVHNSLKTRRCISVKFPSSSRSRKVNFFFAVIVLTLFFVSRMFLTT